MAGLLGLLNLGAGAIAAQNAGVAVAGRNTANVNTPGYSRETATLEALGPSPFASGVRADDPSRASDERLSSRERAASGDQGQSSALSSALSSLENDLAPQTTDLVTASANLSSAVGSLAASPTDSALRSQVLANAQVLTQGFQRMNQTISQARSDSDARIAGQVATANSLAAKIVAANKALSSTSDPVILDQRDQAARQLAAIVGGQARFDADGRMRVTTNAGASIVYGDSAATLTTTQDPSNGNHLGLSVVYGSQVTDVTTSLTGGSIAGEIAFRDGAAATAVTRLDALAFATATQWNTVHAANAGLDGVIGRNLFTQPAAAAGAAGMMSIDPAVDGQPQNIAAGAAGAGTNDNTGALALGALKDAILPGGTRTFVDESISIAGDVGSATKSAGDQAQLASSRMDVLASARDALSGVSTQDELASLAAFQHASEAATKFVATLNDLLSNLIQNV